MKKENEEELAKLRPALEEATKAVSELTKEAITELKTFKVPPAVVKNCVELAFLYLGENAKDWKVALGVLSDIKFLDRLKNYDNKNIPPKVINEVKKIVTAETFNPQEISTKVSQAAGALAKWAKATYEFDKAWKNVKPKEIRARELMEKFKIAEE